MDLVFFMLLKLFEFFFFQYGTLTWKRRLGFWFKLKKQHSGYCGY